VLCNGSSAAYIRIGYCSTAIPREGSRHKCAETSGSAIADDDIVYSHVKA